MVSRNRSQRPWLQLLYLLLAFCVVRKLTGAEHLPGSWEIVVENAGIPAMHGAVTHFGNVVLLDRTDVGPSLINLADSKCRDDPNDFVLPHDCTAHSILFTPEDNSIRPLTILTDTWCSSGQFLPDGTLLHTGGDLDGASKIRKFVPCPSDGNCDWEELDDVELGRGRWYSTNQLLPDGRTIVVGGRGQFNLEFVPPSPAGVIDLPFLQQTHDEQMDNLYPYVHLLPDGSLFIFANQDAILYNYTSNTVVRNYPSLSGNPRNYPSAGSSVMLPLTAADSFAKAEIIVCGGAHAGAFLHPQEQWPANDTCGRIVATDAAATWEIEQMPFKRIMGDMVLLPTGDIIILNGAQAGAQGFAYATQPCFNPVRYQPNAAAGLRFSVLTPTTIARMYHSAANLLPDGRILVSGSNPHYYYSLADAFPTELRIEAFSPEYLSSNYSTLRPSVLSAPRVLNYGQKFSVHFEVQLPVTDTVELNLASAPFVTHSFAQGQRLLKLQVTAARPDKNGTYIVSGTAPPSSIIAPPSYYMLFVVNQGIPSKAAWVHVVSP